MNQMSHGDTVATATASTRLPQVPPPKVRGHGRATDIGHCPKPRLHLVAIGPQSAASATAVVTGISDVQEPRPLQGAGPNPITAGDDTAAAAATAVPQTRGCGYGSGDNARSGSGGAAPLIPDPS